MGPWFFRFSFFERILDISYKDRFCRGVKGRAIREKGHLFRANPNEEFVYRRLAKAGKSATGRGYPNITVYKENGSVHGFIEIMNHRDREFKPEQEAFANLCGLKGIPYMVWSPDKDPELLDKFLEKGELSTMRCSCCDKALTEKEIIWNDDINNFDMCTVCLDIAYDAAYGSRRNGLEEDVLDTDFDDYQYEFWNTGDDYEPESA